MRYSVRVPLPPRECSPNYEASTVRERILANQARARYRDHVALRALETRLPRLDHATLHLEFYLCRGYCDLDRYQNSDRYFPRDPDNALAAAKRAIDGLVRAGVLLNDTARYLSLGTVTLHTKKKDHQGKTCLVISLETDDA